MENNKSDIKNEQENFEDMSNQEFDEAINAMQNDIQKEIAASSYLVGEICGIECLEKEYSADDVEYQSKLRDLKMKYSHIRKTRGDGNCFFRAFGFGYLERMLNNKTDYAEFEKYASGTFKKLMDLKYPSFTVEDFFDNFMATVRSVESISDTDLINTFRDEGMSNYFVVYLRLIVSCQLQTEADFYQYFVDGGKSIVEFCKTEVEPMYQESDHIHITALTSALGAKVRVAYMDRGGGGKMTYHDFPDGCEPSLHLLYRPGHYDILYPR